MNDAHIAEWVRTDQLRRRSLDKERVKSMIESSIMNMEIVQTIPLTEQSAILIFRETYESIRQLGDARWWVLGYEPRTHEVSMEILKDANIQEKVRLNHLGRFKKIRNDVNYRGFKVTVSQAQEITEFWDACANEIIALVRNALG